MKRALQFSMKVAAISIATTGIGLMGLGLLLADVADVIFSYAE